MSETTSPHRTIAERFIDGRSSAGQPAVSPDGTRVAFVVATVDLEKNITRSRVWLDDAPVSAGDHDGNPTWSHDGRFLAFTSRRGEKQGDSTLHVLPIDGPGELWALMLDTASTFDGLVRANAATPEQAERILANGFYRNVAGSLSGTQEYMAAERLHALHDDKRFDLVIIDTPPTRNALDFLDAPNTLTKFIDHPLFKILMLPTRRGLKVLNFAANDPVAILRLIKNCTNQFILRLQRRRLTVFELSLCNRVIRQFGALLLDPSQSQNIGYGVPDR